MNPPQVYTCSPSWNPLPSPSPYHPSGSSQCTSPKHPASCIEPGLVTHFIHDSIHVSMPFSQIFPASPSHRVHKTVLYISVSFAISNFTFYLQLKPAQLLFNSSRNFQSKSYFSTTLSKTIVQHFCSPLVLSFSHLNFGFGEFIHQDWGKMVHFVLFVLMGTTSEIETIEIISSNP